MVRSQTSEQRSAGSATEFQRTSRRAERRQVAGRALLVLCGDPFGARAPNTSDI